MKTGTPKNEQKHRRLAVPKTLFCWYSFGTPLSGTMTSRSVGYARISTGHQSLDAQVAQLKEAGCSVVFQEQVSTRKKESERPQLQAALNSLQEGDEICCVALSRLGRDQREVINRLHDLQEKGIDVRTLDGLVNTKGLGKFAPILIGLFTGLNQVEREITRERTLESVAYRRENNLSLGGRPKTNKEKEQLVLRLRDEGCS